MNLGSNSDNERNQFAFDLNVKPVEDDNSDFPENSDSCTICLLPLVNTRDDRRTLVTLTCSHKFHLDCIGSAFNARGLMQCPNCMQIEPGQWRYATNTPNPNIREGVWIFDDAEEENDYANSDSAPQSSVGPYFNSHMITPIEEVIPNVPPPNQLIFSTVLEPGVMTEGQYHAHPSFHHTDSAPQSSVGPYFNSHMITPTEEVLQNVPPPNQLIFSTVLEPGVMTEGQYHAHPSFHHTDSAPQSSVGPYFNSHMITPTEEVLQNVPPPNQLIFSTVLEPGVMTGGQYHAHPSFHHTPSVHNAPLFLPYPNDTTTVQVNQIPPLSGDLLGPVSDGHMFSSGMEQAGEISTFYMMPAFFGAVAVEPAEQVFMTMTESEQQQ